MTMAMKTTLSTSCFFPRQSQICAPTTIALTLQISLRVPSNMVVVQLFATIWNLIRMRAPRWSPTPSWNMAIPVERCQMTMTAPFSPQLQSMLTAVAVPGLSSTAQSMAGSRPCQRSTPCVPPMLTRLTSVSTALTFSAKATTRLSTRTQSRLTSNREVS